MNDTTDRPGPLERAASSLVAARNRQNGAARPIDTKVAKAEFEGQCKMASVVFPGLATPFAVQLAVFDAERRTVNTHGSRPTWRAMDNTSLHFWDAEFAVFVVKELREHTA